MADTGKPRPQGNKTSKLLRKSIIFKQTSSDPSSEIKKVITFLWVKKKSITMFCTEQKTKEKSTRIEYQKMSKYKAIETGLPIPMLSAVPSQYWLSKSVFHNGSSSSWARRLCRAFCLPQFSFFLVPISWLCFAVPVCLYHRISLYSPFLPIEILS